MGILSSKRLCCKCGTQKSTSEFHRDSSRKDGLYPYCKACVSAYKRKNPQPYTWRPITEKRRENNRRYVTEWNKRNPAKVAIKRHLRRARLNGAEGTHTPDEWRALCDWFGNICLACGKKEVTLDHVVPLSKRGTNYLENLQPLCHSCNSRKNDRTIDYRDPELLERFFEHYYNDD